ncbi:hypothetical protein Tco_0942681 [Tanacetum coccineum]
MKGKQSNEFISSDLNKYGKPTPSNFYNTQNPDTCEAFDNASSGCASTFIGVGMGSHIFGSNYAFEGHSCHSRNPELYLDVFEKYIEFYGGNTHWEASTTFRGTVLLAGLRRANFRKRKLQTDADNNVFESYSSLCSNNTSKRRTVDLP